MGEYTSQLTKELRPKLQSLKDDLLARKNPDFFWPTGTQVYCGKQGSGKTISAVKHLIQLKERYPKAKLVSNIQFTNLQKIHFTNKTDLIQKQKELKNNQYLYFSDMEQLALALTNINNGYYGVIYIVDEIHTYFNALESKNIPMYVFTEISQQRKQRKLIIGTSQLFLRMAKPFREQCDNLIICNTLFGVFTMQKAYDGMSLTQDYDGSLSGQLKKIGWFYHTRKIRKAFNTYQKVVSGAEQYEQSNELKIIDKSKTKFSLGKK
jgi:hypothetical protein